MQETRDTLSLHRAFSRNFVAINFSIENQRRSSMLTRKSHAAYLRGGSCERVRRAHAYALSQEIRARRVRLISRSWRGHL